MVEARLVTTLLATVLEITAIQADLPQALIATLVLVRVLARVLVRGRAALAR